MRIKGCRTIEEFKQNQVDRIQRFIDRHFVEDSVTWEFHGGNAILIRDKFDDSMIVFLRDID